MEKCEKDKRDDKKIFAQIHHPNRSCCQNKMHMIKLQHFPWCLLPVSVGFFAAFDSCLMLIYLY